MRVCVCVCISCVCVIIRVCSCIRERESVCVCVCMCILCVSVCLSNLQQLKAVFQVEEVPVVHLCRLGVREEVRRPPLRRLGRRKAEQGPRDPAAPLGRPKRGTEWRENGERVERE